MIWAVDGVSGWFNCLAWNLLFTYEFLKHQKNLILVISSRVDLSLVFACYCRWRPLYKRRLKEWAACEWVYERTHINTIIHCLLFQFPFTLQMPPWYTYTLIADAQSNGKSVLNLYPLILSVFFVLFQIAQCFSYCLRYFFF